jgi:hypothetical protein
MTQSEGHLISDAQLAKSGHRVLCIAFAVYEWGALCRDDDPDPLDFLLQFEDEELSEELLKLSALARAKDDVRNTLDESAKSFPNGVGTLTSGGKTVSLAPREACNKIIHARKMRLNLARSDKNPIWDKWYESQGQSVRKDFKIPSLLLEGEHFQTGPWTARLELVQFVYAVALTDIWPWNIAGQGHES